MTYEIKDLGIINLKPTHNRVVVTDIVEYDDFDLIAVATIVEIGPLAFDNYKPDYQKPCVGDKVLIPYREYSKYALITDGKFDTNTNLYILLDTQILSLVDFVDFNPVEVKRTTLSLDSLASYIQN